MSTEKPTGKRKPARKQKKDLDDTPRQFKRLMALQERLTQKSKPNNKREHSSESLPRKHDNKEIINGGQGPTPLENPVKLERKRGESSSDFNRRVDQAIPLPRARGTDSRKTIKNAKKHKRTAENLRAEYKQKLEAKRRRQEEADDENDNLVVEDDGEDIWASVNAKAKKPKFGEVADRPPELPKLKQFSSVPKSAGSSARRQISEAERQKVIDSYRKMKGTASVEFPEQGELE